MIESNMWRDWYGICFTLNEKEFMKICKRKNLLKFTEDYMEREVGWKRYLDGRKVMNYDEYEKKKLRETDEDIFWMTGNRMSPIRKEKQDIRYWKNWNWKNIMGKN
jgi:hypothetical protein